MQKKIIIWDLFGGTQNSIYNCLKDDDNYVVITFDSTESTRPNHHTIDLTNLPLFKKYIKKHKIPKPTTITASPPVIHSALH
jgi:hypothetical protein